MGMRVELGFLLLWLFCLHSIYLCRIPLFGSIMASKRSRVQGESSGSRLAEIKEEVKQRNILQEREFKYDEAIPFCLRINQSGLTGLTQKRRHMNETFVRHFYAHGQFNNSLQVQFRERTINVTPDAIRRVIGLPEGQECRWSNVMQDPEDYPWDDISRVLGARWEKPRDRQSYIARQQLSAESRNWWHFISNNALPTSHRANILPPAALLMYLLMTAQPVRMEYVLFSSLHACVMQPRPRQCLVLPHLITDLYKDAGVFEKPTDRVRSQGLPFRYIRLERQQDVEDDQPEGEPECEESGPTRGYMDQAEPSGGPPDCSLEQRMIHLENRVDEIATTQKEIADRLQGMDERQLAMYQLMQDMAARLHFQPPGPGDAPDA